MAFSTGAELDLELKRIDQGLRQAGQLGHRLALVVHGSRDWCITILKRIVSAIRLTEGIVVSKNFAPVGWTSAKTASELLGIETPALVLDLFDGFNPDLLGAASGVVQQGGLFVLLAPDFGQWAALGDVDYERMRVYGYDNSAFRYRFIQRFVSQTTRQSAIGIWSERDGLSGIVQPVLPALLPESREKRFSDQNKAIAAIEKLMGSRAKRPLVITADRGRGKSAALGKAAARILQNRPGCILVTAPTQQNAEVLFRHALADGSQDVDFSGRLMYLPPDRISLDLPKADLVMVDEAAAIAPVILEKIVRHYQRVVFASTLYGYEGSGRGFEVRFFDVLDRLTPDWRRMTLEQPIRWAQGDPLEQWVADALILKGLNRPPSLKTDPAQHQSSVFSIQPVSQQELLADEGLLCEVFALLVEAHYRTTPSDLRDLLDGLNLKIWLAKKARRVVGVALVAEEGPLESVMADAIYSGNRRPRGHLIPQMMLSQLGLREQAVSRFARIVRIAVQADHRRAGIARNLLKAVEHHYLKAGYAGVGSLFGASDQLVKFWQSCAYTPVRLGYSRQVSSGEHSLLVIKALNSDLDLHALKSRFAETFLYQLADEFRSLEASLVLVLLEQNDCIRISFSDWQREEIQALVRGRRLYHGCSTSVFCLTRNYLAQHKASQQLAELHQELLVKKVMQRIPDGELIHALNLSGKKALHRELRAMVAAMSERLWQHRG